MKGIHINWTMPFAVRHGGTYFAEDFELLTTMLSALKWKEKNGTIKLWADDTALAYYDRIGILPIYDETACLSVDRAIDPNQFWAAGKLFALRREQAPIAVLDNDFIVWEPILFDKLGDCTVIHFEEIQPEVYPPRDFFKMRQGYQWQDWNWEVQACNTAFWVIQSPPLLKYYTDTAIDFMINAEKNDDPLRYMVFAEQRLLPMCADKLGIPVHAFSQLERLFAHGEGCFTHTWGMKQQMREQPELRRSFCRRCVDRICRDFPEYAEIAEKMIENDTD